jgi:protease-4
MPESNEQLNLSDRSNGDPSDRWERQLIQDLASGALKEQRRARRWGILFKSLFFLYLCVLLYVLMSAGETPTVPMGKHTALVDLSGTIAEDTQASADNILRGLRKAFDDKKAGVILRANSPGGSPVQAAYVYDEIKRLRKKHPKVPVYLVVSDMCASACYYIASAADRIYANRGSLVGSIGVLYNGFGFTGLMDKLGIQRRLLTAGAHKGMMDPFSPMNEADVEHFQKMLAEIHQQFIDAVKEGRGDRLKPTPDLFSGLIWTGERSVQLGLVDGLASADDVARDVIGEEDTVDYTSHQGVLERLANRLGSSVAEHLLPASAGTESLR